MRRSMVGHRPHRLASVVSCTVLCQLLIPFGVVIDRRQVALLANIGHVEWRVAKQGEVLCESNCAYCRQERTVSTGEKGLRQLLRCGKEWPMWPFLTRKTAMDRVV